MRGTGGREGARWGAAVALLVATVALSVLDALPLVLLPLGLVLLLLPPRRSAYLLVGGGALVLGGLMGGGLFGAYSLAWAAVVAAIFVVVRRARPGWGFFPCALAAVSLVLGTGFVASLAAGRWGGVDEAMLAHFRSVAEATLAQLRDAAPGSAFTTHFEQAGGEVARLQWTLFPAVLALQTLAALALAWWGVTRFRRGDEPWRPLRPLAEFRFNDQLVWVLIAGILLVMLPLDAVAARAGWNALFFMGSLYALRGVAVFLFLSSGAPTLVSVIFGVFAALFLYPLVLTAALVVGLGDTWLDVRSRVAAAARG